MLWTAIKCQEMGKNVLSVSLSISLSLFRLSLQAFITLCLSFWHLRRIFLLFPFILVELRKVHDAKAILLEYNIQRSLGYKFIKLA